MKKVFLIMVTVIMISTCGNCQWYQRRYGVNNINQLSEQQLTEAFLRARGGARAGALLTTASAIGIVSGILIASSADNIGRAGEARAYIGVFLAFGSLPIGLLGAPIWGISGTRLKTIKGIMKNTEIKIGLINYPASIKSGGLSCSSIPGFSITFNF
jgi:hypothetical protein